MQPVNKLNHEDSNVNNLLKTLVKKVFLAALIGIMPTYVFGIGNVFLQLEGITGETSVEGFGNETVLILDETVSEICDKRREDMRPALEVKHRVLTHAVQRLAG